MTDRPKLKKWRRDNGLSQAEAANRFGISRRQLSDIENGAETRFSTIERICRVTGLEPNDFFDPELSPSRTPAPA